MGGRGNDPPKKGGAPPGHGHREDRRQLLLPKNRRQPRKKPKRAVPSQDENIMDVDEEEAVEEREEEGEEGGQDLYIRGTLSYLSHHNIVANTTIVWLASFGQVAPEGATKELGRLCERPLARPLAFRPGQPRVSHDSHTSNLSALRLRGRVNLGESACLPAVPP